MNTELFTALENLVQLKRWKDEHGKDEHYLKNQQPVWNAAFSTYDKFINTHHHDTKMITEQMHTNTKNVSEQTDEQQMEQDAREMFEKHRYFYDGEPYLDYDCGLAALTEFGKMWKERGRKEAIIDCTMYLTEGIGMPYDDYTGSDNKVVLEAIDTFSKWSNLTTLDTAMCRERGREEESHNNWVMVKDAEIEKLQQQLEERDTEIEMLATYVEELQKELTAAKEKEFAALSRSIDYATKIYEEMEDKEKEIEEFAEWTSERRWNHLYGMGWQKVMPNKTVYITTNELLQMFRDGK